MGVICYTPLPRPPPKSPGPLSLSPKDPPPDFSTSFQPGAPPWARLPWSLTWTIAGQPPWILAASLAPYTLFSTRS